MRNFSDWPLEGDFRPRTIFITLLLVVSAFVGIGQIPLFLAVLGKVDSQQIQSLGQAAMVEQLGYNYFLTLILIPFVACLGMFWLSFRYVHKSNSLNFFTLRPELDWKRILLSFTLWGAFLIFMHCILLATTDQVVWNFKSDEFLMLLVISLFILPLQTTCEELLFRSYLFKAFGIFKLPISRILITSVLFAIMHGMNPEVEKLGMMALFYYLWTGILLGLYSYLDDGLELAIGYHAINNIFAAAVLTADWHAFQTAALWLDKRPPEFGWELWLTLFVFQPVMFLIFMKKYKWNLKKLFTA